MKYTTFTKCVIAVLVVIGGTPATSIAAAKITPDDVAVAENLPFREKINKHALILEKLSSTLAEAKKAKDSAKANNSLSEYLAGEEDENNAIHFLAPYAIADAKKDELAKQGYKLANWEGSICNAGACAEIDPITALMFIIGNLLVDELNKEKPFGSNNDLVKAFNAIVVFVNRPLGGPNSDLVKIREAILLHDKNGEIAQLIRDPIKRPIEIVQNARDKIIPPSDNGEIAKAVRDPIKCTVGHLWGGCN